MAYCCRESPLPFISTRICGTHGFLCGYSVRQVQMLAILKAMDVLAPSARVVFVMHLDQNYGALSFQEEHGTLPHTAKTGGANFAKLFSQAGQFAHPKLRGKAGSRPASHTS